MDALLAGEFAAFLARADVSQAAFARLTGVTPRQVNNWARGRATAPLWAVTLAVLLRDHSPEALTIAVEEARQGVAAAEPEPLPAHRPGPAGHCSAPTEAASADRHGVQPSQGCERQRRPGMSAWS
jgi:transcriptional regulator with XRE-family HTH domain